MQTAARVLAVILLLGGLHGLRAMAAQEKHPALPTSTRSPKELYLAGQSQKQQARYAEAAESFEAAARSLPPDDPDVLDALRSAIGLRVGLGQAEQGGRDVALFLLRLRSRPEIPGLVEEAASWSLAVAQLYEEQGEERALRRHLSDYLRTFGERGGVDRNIAAEAMLGLLAWRQSCPISDLNGLCVTVGPDAEPATLHCGPAVGPQLRAMPRRAALRARALAHFERVVTLYANGLVEKAFLKDEQRRGSLRLRVAVVRRVQSDDLFEQFLAVPPAPTGLRYSSLRSNDSQRKVDHWIWMKTNKYEAANKAYRELGDLKEADTIITAAWRRGQLFTSFADALATIEIPEYPPPPQGKSPKYWAANFKTAFCDPLRERTKTLHAWTVEILTDCLRKTVELNWPSRWAGLCEQELTRWLPRERLRHTEFYTAPVYSSPLIDLAPLIP